MNTRLKNTQAGLWRNLLLVGPALLIGSSLAVAQDNAVNDDEVFELSPFEVDASEDMGYYASQSLAGGRLSTDIINTGTSIEVVTMDFMDDIGASDIEELLQYTTSTEVGGALGNFTGAQFDVAQGNVNSTQAMRNPSQNARIRGLAKPDNTRDFFKTDIPMDQYNSERVDINRGSNSFLFGLGSPAGLINNQLKKARFRDSSRIRIRLASGGDRPTFKGEIDLNRVIIKDKLAIRVASMGNRQTYRQEPAFRDDNRIYVAGTYHPFDNNKMTTIRAHWESGDQNWNAVSNILPLSAVDTWIKYRIPFDADFNTRFWRQQYGPSSGDLSNQWKNNTPRYPQDMVDEIYSPPGTLQSYWPSYDGYGTTSITNHVRPAIGGLINNMGANGYAMVWDGTTSGPNMAFANQHRAVADLFFRGNGNWGARLDGARYYRPANLGDGDAWWSPVGNRTAGNPSMRVYQNSFQGDDRGIGWYKQGLTNMDLFDFSKQKLSWDNDFGYVDFYNYNFAIEHLFLDGKAGFEFAFDFQNHTRDVWTSLSGTGMEIMIDINRTIPLPQYDSNGQMIMPEYWTLEDYNNGLITEPSLVNSPKVDPTTGTVVGGAMLNPNFGRPFVVSKTGRGLNRNDRQAMRFTSFYKLNFEDYSGDDGWLRWLGEHTFSFLADSSVEEYEYFGRTLRSFGEDFAVGPNIADASGLKATTGVRTVPRVAYIGPPVQSYLGDAVWDPNMPVSMSNIIIEPLEGVNLFTPDGFTMPITYWDRGTDGGFALDNNGKPIPGVPNPNGVPVSSYSAGDFDPLIVGEENVKQFVLPSSNTDAQKAGIINGDESWQQGTYAPQWIPDEGVQIRHAEVKSWAINAQSFFFNRHLVINTGYREDYIKSWLNKEVNKVGPDLVPDISPEAFRWQDGEYSEVSRGPEGSGTFGWGAVLHMPKNLIKLPESMDISFHYNQSENFVPDTSRRSIRRFADGSLDVIRLASPQGESLDYGVTFQLFDRKLIVRLNWYENTLIGADSSLNNVFNQNLSKVFAYYGKLRSRIVQVSSESGTIDGPFSAGILPEIIEENREYDEYDENDEPVPGTGQTDAEVIEENWPMFEEAKLALSEMDALINSGYMRLKQERQRVTIGSDGSIDDEWLNGLTDLEDIRSEGFEASITWNPTRNWRWRINVAQQETVRTNIAPDLTRFIEGDWLPFVVKWKNLDWSNPLEEADESLLDNVNENLLKYFTVKAQEGFPSDEVREWRVNLVTNYTFREGFLDGFGIGASARWQSDAVVGYPLIDKEIENVGTITVGDVLNGWRGEEDFSYDLQASYDTKIGKDINWKIQVNLRNLQNISQDGLETISAQPDGTPARVRWQPPFEVQLTNTFNW